MADICPTCGGRTAAMNGDARGINYDDTQGGHNDRHTLVVEAAERALEGEDAQ